MNSVGGAEGTGSVAVKTITVFLALALLAGCGEPPADVEPGANAPVGSKDESTVKSSPGAASAGVHEKPDAPTQKWNAVVIGPDTTRADHLSINGYHRQTTPHIDALAREGANFTHAVTVAPRT